MSGECKFPIYSPYCISAHLTQILMMCFTPYNNMLNVLSCTHFCTFSAPVPSALCAFPRVQTFLLVSHEASSPETLDPPLQKICLSHQESCSAHLRSYFLVLTPHVTLSPLFYSSSVSAPVLCPHFLGVKIPKILHCCFFLSWLLSSMISDFILSSGFFPLPPSFNFKAN